MPCKPGMTGCRPGCRHRQIVLDYRFAREAAEQIREAVTAGYAAETAGYGPIITFKQWLQDTAGGGL